MERGYFVHEKGHTVVDNDLKNQDNLNSVTRLIGGEEFKVPPIGWEVWVRGQGDSDDQSSDLIWIHHTRRVALFEYPSHTKDEEMTNLFSFKERE